MKYQISEETKNSISNMNEYLLTRGFELSEAEIEELLQYQKEVLQLENCIEFDDQKAFKIILPYTSSPYLRYESKMDILKGAIALYYTIRMKFDWHLDDEELIEMCYKNYSEFFGIFDKNLVQQFVSKLKKEGYSNRDNISK